MAGNRRRVVVAGAGLAGSSAAWLLAGRGFSVQLLERNSLSGGRAGSAPDPETGEPIDTGQHAMMGCYSSTLRWLREMGTDHLVRFQPRLEVAYASNPPVIFRARRLPAPLNLLGGVLALPGMTTALLLKSLPLWKAILARRSLDEITVSEWANQLGIPGPVRKWVLNPLALAAINEPPETGSAYPMARVMRRIARRGGKWSAMGWATAGMGELYVPQVRQRIESSGGVVRNGAEVRGIIVEGGRTAGVRLSGGEEVRSDAVVLALPPWDLPKVLEGIPSCSGISAGAGLLKPSPLLTVHLWLDIPVMEAPFMGLVDCPFDWLFNRTYMMSPEGGHLGETGSRRTGPARKGLQPAPPMAGRGLQPVQPLAGRGLQQIALLRSGAREMLGKNPAELEGMALDCLRRSLPGAKSAQVVHRRIVWVTQGTVSLVPGTNKLRPGVRTPINGLYLAGGWTNTGLPDTIEGAVVSGRKVAGLV